MLVCLKKMSMCLSRSMIESKTESVCVCVCFSIVCLNGVQRRCYSSLGVCMVNPYVSIILENMSLPKAERHNGVLTISSQNSTWDNKVPLPS